MKKIDGKECNIAKGVNVATEFKKFKDVLFNDDKRYDKRYVLDDGTRTLAYFHKNSITSCKEIEKDCDKKHRNN